VATVEVLQQNANVCRKDKGTCRFANKSVDETFSASQVMADLN